MATVRRRTGHSEPARGQAASARDVTITSFDGTKIAAHWFPGKGVSAGKPAPTILEVPGWSQPGDSASGGGPGPGQLFGVLGIGNFIAHGYNVLTWDPRGFGQSEGTVQSEEPGHLRDEPERPDFGNGGRKLWGRHPARLGGDRQAHRCDRANDLLALADHEPVPGAEHQAAQAEAPPLAVGERGVGFGPMRVLITSSRMPFALDAIRKLGERGHEVYASDSYEASPGNHSRYLAGHFVTASPSASPRPSW